MKCPNCGAEMEYGRVCEYCGAHITSEMLHEQELLNKTGCPKCGSTNISFNREKHGEVKGKKSTVVVRHTVGLCKDCGYTWRVNDGAPENKKSPIWLWVIGWILIFPLPLTILLLKKKDFKPVFKWLIIILAWIVYIGIGIGSTTASMNKKQKTESSTKAVSNSTVAEKTSQATSEVNLDDAVETFVNGFNSTSETKLIFKESFTPSDKSSAHYRTEFRLGAYKDAIGKSYSFGDSSVDIVQCKSYLQGLGEMRVYAITSSHEQAVEIIRIASPLMDPEITTEELQKAVDYVEKNKSVNGYYYSNLGIVLLGNDLMIKPK